MRTKKFILDTVHSFDMQISGKALAKLRPMVDKKTISFIKILCDYAKDKNRKTILERDIGEVIKE